MRFSRFRQKCSTDSDWRGWQSHNDSVRTLSHSTLLAPIRRRTAVAWQPSMTKLQIWHSLMLFNQLFSYGFRGSSYIHVILCFHKCWSLQLQSQNRKCRHLAIAWTMDDGRKFRHSPLSAAGNETKTTLYDTFC